MNAAPTTALLPSVEAGPCRDCDGEATRTLGRFPFCDECAAEILDGIRARIVARTGIGVGVMSGARAPDIGPRAFGLTCSVCGATWVGRHGDPCGWCEAAHERQRDDQREALLSPPWLTDEGPAYQSLASVDRAVWDATQGNVRGAGSLVAWGERLGRAVESGLVTEAEARRALAGVRW